MIEVTHSEADDTQIEIRMRPPITQQDYTETLVPALDDAIARSDRIRALVLLDAGVSDFTLGAMAADARTGLKHWRGFDRLAIATDHSGVAGAIRAVSVFMPCPVRIFPASEADAARTWLREELGSIRFEDRGEVLHVRLEGKLDSAAYEGKARELSAILGERERIRLLLDVREFDGWQGLGALADHFRMVRSHVRRIERAAVVGDAGWQAMAVKVGKLVLGAEGRWFAAEDFDAASEWVAG